MPHHAKGRLTRSGTKKTKGDKNEKAEMNKKEKVWT